MLERSPIAILGARRVVALLITAVVLGGCATSPSPSAPTRSPRPVYSVWEVDTLAELDQLLDIKGCEGWRFDQAFARGEKLVVVIERDGPAPPPNPACRPETP